MNGKDIFRGMRYLDTKFIEKAEFGEFSQEAFYRDKSTGRGVRRSVRRPILIAAAIVLSLLLVGCGVVYVLKMQDLKLGDQKVTQEWWDDEQKTMLSETVSQQVLTFAGLKGTARYEAAREWYEFKKTYDPDWKIYHERKDADTLDYGTAEYSLYNTYTQEMRDKIDEITEKYGLKLQGKQVKAVSANALYDYLGMDGVLLPDAKAKADDFNAAYYDGGWFHADMHMTLMEEPDWPYQFLCSLYYSATNTFDTNICELNDTADWQEWNYTTKSGHTVLVLRSPSAWFSWVFCDRGDATITLRVETSREVYTDEHGYREVMQTPMTDEQFQKVIDTIDFDIRPVPGDAALLDGPAASKELTQTSNGYAVTVKEVFTDGLTAKILLGITAPENVDLEQYLAQDTQGFLNFSRATLDYEKETDSLTGDCAHSAKPDNDGKANTVNYTVETSYTMQEGIAFPKGTVSQLYLQDLYVNGWNENLSQWEAIWEMEGTWNFEITLDNGEWTEIEFVSEPITTNVCYGWDMDGNDVFRDETITSLKLRSFGAEYTAPDALGLLDFADIRKEQFPKVVLKDGSEIKLNSDLTVVEGRIPMDEVDYLELIDGTVLYPVEVDPDRATDYQLEVKSAVTDGKTAQVVLKLTVPYGTEMCKENCEYSIGFGNFGNYSILMPMDSDLPSVEELKAKYALGETLEAREDGDGRDDTVEIVYTMYVDTGEDSLEYFTPGSNWLFHIENMSAERMHYPEGTLTEIEQLWTAYGVRNVDVTFEGIDHVES